MGEFGAGGEVQQSGRLRQLEMRRRGEEEIVGE
jgi:hypothetical protein